MQIHSAYKKVVCYFLGMLLTPGCTENNKLPGEKYYQFTFTAKYSYNNDSLKFEIKNPLKCPLRISLSSPDKLLQYVVAKFGTLTLGEESDTIIYYYIKRPKNIILNFNSVVGDPDKKIIKEKISLPFPKNTLYTIVQGYNGSKSHNTDYSRNAIDFSLKINDTVCTAAEGYVVGVIKDYELGGRTEDWTDYCNYITVYHPASGLFTQYVHLVKNGSFVTVGDSVAKGQPIGLSGMTGYTTGPHLHFNVLTPYKGGLASTEIEFEEGYRGTELIKNTTVKK